MTETHTRGSRGRRFLSRERRDAATLSRDEGDSCGTFRSIGDETGRRRHCLYFDTEAYFMNFFYSRVPRSAHRLCTGEFT